MDWNDGFHRRMAEYRGESEYDEEDRDDDADRCEHGVHLYDFCEDCYEDEG